jgi:ABC-2 type transport system ATP-binding protein
MLETNQLRKSYGTNEVLKGVDLKVAAGEICTLIGPNGAGKSSLVSILCGTRNADSGSFRIACAGGGEGKGTNGIGCAPQELGLYPTLSARRNLLFFAGINGLKGRERRSRVERVAEELGIADILDKRVSSLSGGQKRRVHAAAAMAHSPGMLFLDEPTAGADIQARASMLEAVKRAAAAGCAVLYATHYLSEAETLGATVAILEGGRIMVRSSIGDFVEAHGVSRAILRFEGEAPRLEGWTAAGGCLEKAGPEPALAAARAVAGLGGAAGRLRGVEVLPASLESAYAALTGRAAAPKGGSDE